MPAPGSERGPEMADVRRELARVLREGEETVLRWWPRSYEKVENYMWIDVEDELVDEL